VRQSEKPNVILILADDMGFADLGVTGSEIRTPNIDALAREGAMLSAMYNCARCCPTRASLLTGLYPHNAGGADGRSVAVTGKTEVQRAKRTLASLRGAAARRPH